MCTSSAIFLKLNRSAQINENLFMLCWMFLVKGEFRLNWSFNRKNEKKKVIFFVMSLTAASHQTSVQLSL